MTSKHIQNIEELARTTEAIIAEWPKWKRDCHEYKKRIRHDREGRTYLIPKEKVSQ